MTCIVGIIDRKENKVYIGGDSAGTSGTDITVRKDVKVFKVDNFVIGCTTSFRMLQLLRFSFHPPKRHPDEDVYKFMCTSFINEMRKCFREGGWLETEKNVESGGTFLVGYEGRLFTIGNDFQVGESADEFDSVGCGAKYALGAIKAFILIDISAKERINTALEIATHFSAGVRPPFIIENTES